MKTIDNNQHSSKFLEVHPLKPFKIDKKDYNKAISIRIDTIISIEEIIESFSKNNGYRTTYTYSLGNGCEIKYKTGKDYNVIDVIESYKDIKKILDEYEY